MACTESARAAEDQQNAVSAATKMTLPFNWHGFGRIAPIDALHSILPSDA
ncbi:MAG: hypothetical protein ACM3ZE_24355 [Myxococcales bacterium]